MKSFKFLFTTLTVALALSLANTADAVIVVANSTTATSTTGDATISGFDMSGGNALVVVVTGADASFTVSDVIVSFDNAGVTNGTPLDTMVNEGTQFASINYLLNPTSSSGDVVISTSTSNAALGVTVLSLSNVSSLNSAATFGEPGTPQTLNYGGLAGGFIVAGGVDNTFGVSTTPTWSGDNFSTYTLELDPDDTGKTGAGAMAHGYGLIGSDGGFSETFTHAVGSSTSRNAGVLLSLNAVAVPEASQVLAFSLVGVVSGLRRRRASAS